MGITLTKLLTVILLIFSLPITVMAAEGSSPTEKYSEKQLLKNWALSRCLGKAYKSQSARDDAYKSASAYMQFASTPLEGFNKITALVQKYLDLTYSGYVPSNYNTMKCIDLFYSKELDKLTSNLASKYKKSSTPAHNPKQ